MNELRWIIAIGGILLLAAIYLWGRFTRRQAAADMVQPPILNQEFVSPVRYQESPDDEGVDRLAGTEFEVDDEEALPYEPVHSDDTTPAATHSRSYAESPRVEPGLGDIDAVPASAYRRERIEPTLGVVEEAKEESTRPKTRAPRKIVTLRLAAPPQHRYEGFKLRQLFESHELEHGKYGIFHRTQDGQSVFSAASMMEPGTFDLTTMDSESYSGITLFMLLPGPVDGVEAFEYMKKCATQVEYSLGGTLQDERGQPLNDLRAGALQQEIAIFQQELHQPRQSTQH